MLLLLSSPQIITIHLASVSSCSGIEKINIQLVLALITIATSHGHVNQIHGKWYVFAMVAASQVMLWPLVTFLADFQQGKSMGGDLDSLQ